MKESIEIIIGDVIKTYQSLTSYQDVVSCKSEKNGNFVDKNITSTKFKFSGFCFYYKSKDFSSFQGDGLEHTIIGRNNAYKSYHSLSEITVEVLKNMENIDVTPLLTENILVKEHLYGYCATSNPIIEFLPFGETYKGSKLNKVDKQYELLEEEPIKNIVCYIIREKSKGRLDDVSQESMKKAFDALPNEASEIIRNLPMNYGEYCELVTYWIDKRTHYILQMEIETIDFPFIGSTNKTRYEVNPIFNENIDDSIFEI